MNNRRPRFNSERLKPPPSNIVPRNPGNYRKSSQNPDSNEDFDENDEEYGYYVHMDTGFTYDRFKTVMLLNGNLVRIKDRLNLKQPITSNIYLETPRGFREYTTFENDAINILEINGIDRKSTKTDYIQRLCRDITLEKGELNENDEYLVLTPSGEVIDIKAFAKIKKENRDPKQCMDEWKKPVMIFTENRLSLSTSVNYEDDADPAKGYMALENFIGLLTNSPDPIIARETAMYVLNYLGRLLIGGNFLKEFFVFLGEKDSGKTTFVNFIKEIMGEYAGVITDGILYDKDSEKIARTLYVLKDKRLLIHSEGSGQATMNTQTLKRITGNTEIALGNQDYSFKIKGKLVEDTNYAPIADNPLDEAFNDRIFFIPFRKRTDLQPDMINDAIKAIYDHKEDIFAAMVHAAADNINALRVFSRVSSEAKWAVHIMRNLERVFYTQVCRIMPEKYCVTGQELLRHFQEWLRVRVNEDLRWLTYLNKQDWTFPSDVEFHREMKKIHGAFNPHGNRGLVYRGIAVKLENIYSGHLLYWQPMDPNFANKQNAAIWYEKQWKKLQATFASARLDMSMDQSIKEDYQKTVNGGFGSGQTLNPNNGGSHSNIW
jgi:energy-coupling factor transporter ATP-binding protein EcfA2